MSEDKLKTAVIGLDENGQLLLEAACQTDYFQIQAVADKDTKLAEKTALEYNCAGYDDYRQLVMQNQLDCLLVADGIHNCAEQVKTSIKKKFNILKLAPPARDFEEAAEFVQLAEGEGVKFAVANPDRFAQSYLALQQFLREAQIGRVFLITAVCAAGGQDYPAWQSDRKLAGGGVLLRNCYGLIDQIICNFKMPEQVYSLTTSRAGDKKQRLYLTEDTAVVTMKFSDTLFGNLTASRTFEQPSEFIKVHGEDKILTVEKNRLTVSDTAGKISENFEYEDSRLSRKKALLKNFALSILEPDENKLVSSGRENLKNMAVIESAYLSARTGFPEEPGKIDSEFRTFRLGSRQV